MEVVSRVFAGVVAKPERIHVLGDLYDPEDCADVG